jgi:uncharacterized membrane protein
MKTITSVISTLAGIFLFVSAAFLFQCPKMESGAYMNCHKANEAVAVLACLIVVGGIVLIFGKNRKVSIFLSAVVAAVSAVTAIVPGILVGLCMMPGMTCRSIFRPVNLICSAVILLSAAVRLVVEMRGERVAK